MGGELVMAGDEVGPRKAGARFILVGCFCKIVDVDLAESLPVSYSNLRWRDRIFSFYLLERPRSQFLAGASGLWP